RRVDSLEVELSPKKDKGNVIKNYSASPCECVRRCVDLDKELDSVSSLVDKMEESLIVREERGSRELGLVRVQLEELRSQFGRQIVSIFEDLESLEKKMASMDSMILERICHQVDALLARKASVV